MIIRIWTKENRFFVFENAWLSRDSYEYIIYQKINEIEQEVGIFPKINVIGIEILKEKI